MDLDEWVAIVGILAMFIILIWGAIAGIRSSVNESFCLSKGYRDVTISWAGMGTAYCIKRVEQTDIVVPVSSIK